MAEKYGKCTNFGLCTKADRREPVAVSEATGLECPECGKPLQPATGKSGGGGASTGFPARKAGIAVVALVAVVGALFAFLPKDEGEPVPEPIPAPEAVPSPAPDPAPAPEPQPVTNPDPVPAPIPAPGPEPAPEPPRPEPVSNPVVTYSGPSSGRIVWEGEIEDKEGLVTIEGATADKGRIVSGGVPGGTPLVLALQDVKNVGIAMTPQQTSGYRRLVLRVKKGKRKAVIDWSVAQ